MGRDPTSSVQNRGVLRLGSKGPAVVGLQKSLQSMGFYRASVDGFYGPKTIDAVKHLQSRLRLVVDGVMGPKTWAALGANPSIQQVGFSTLTETQVRELKALLLGTAVDSVVGEFAVEELAAGGTGLRADGHG